MNIRIPRSPNVFLGEGSAIHINLLRSSLPTKNISFALAFITNCVPRSQRKSGVQQVQTAELHFTSDPEVAPLVYSLNYTSVVRS